MSHTTFRLLLTFSFLYVIKSSTVLSTNKSCDTRIVYHIIRHSNEYRCLCNKEWKSSILDEFCSNQTHSLNNESWWMICGVETSRILACPRLLSKPSGAVIPTTSTTKSTLSESGRLTVYGLQIEGDNSLIRFLSGLMEHLQPNDLPLGLIKDLFVLKIPVQIVSLQILKLEALGLSWIFLWFILSLSLPVSLITYFCFTPKHALIDNSSESSDTANKEHIKIILGVCINIFLLCLLTNLLILLYSNQQVSQTVGKSFMTTEVIMKDLEHFLKNSEEQVVNATTETAQTAIKDVTEDLDNVENLLGKSYQEHLTRETGVDVALAALLELQNAITVMSTQTSNLLEGCDIAKKIRADLQDELKDISGQVLMMRYQCSLKDRRLCDTLQPTGFNVVFSVKSIIENKKLKKLSQLKEHSNFNASIKTAEETFENIPMQIAEQTLAIRTDIKRVLEKRRLQITESVVELQDISRNLTAAIRRWRKKITDLSKDLMEYDLWRWLLTIIAALAVFTTLLFFTCGSPCGCSSTSQKLLCLSCGLASSSISCLFIWYLASFYFLIGGHSYGFLCQPFNDHPQYITISGLIDPEGILFETDGIWKHMLKKNINVGFAEFLQKCERNETIFDILHIKIPNENSINFTEIENLFRKLTINGSIQMLTQEFDKQLQELSSILSVDMTKERIALAEPVTGRDLSSFVDQLNTIARKLSDRATIKKVEDLGYRIKSILKNKVETLSKLRNEIIFNVTRLEVLLSPLNREIQETLLHFRTIQLFFENQAKNIVLKVIQDYTAKLKNHLQNFAQSSKQITKDIGNCNPLWKIIDVVRYNICNLFTDYMNCLSFCCFFCIFLYLILTPMIVISMQINGHVEEVTPSMTRRLLEDNLEAWATPLSICSPDLGREIIPSLGSIHHHGIVTPLPSPHPPSVPFIQEPQHSPPKRFKQL